MTPAADSVDPRERAVVYRAIVYGLVILRFLGEDRYIVQGESEMDLTQLEEFLDMLDAPRK